MKISILVNSLTKGGAQRVASLWARGFSEQGHSVNLLIRESNLPISYPVPKCVEILSVKPSKEGAFMSLRYDIKLRKILQSNMPELLISVVDGYGLHAKIATMGLGIIIIQTEHNSFEKRSNNHLSRKQQFYKLYGNRFVSAVTVLSHADMKYIGKRLHNVFVLPNPLAFQPTISTHQKKNIIFAAGRLDAGYCKGFDVLLKSFSIITKKYPTWELHIAGDGSDEVVSYYQSILKKECIVDKVRFLGFQKDILPLYQEAEIFVLSSRWEGFGMVLIEAMSQGCACIACDHLGRQREIISDGENGIICEPDNVQMLADKIEELINNTSLRTKIQHNAVSRSKNYELDVIMDIWKSILQQIM